MNLGPARIGEKGAALMSPPNGRGVAAHGQCRQIVDFTESAGSQHDSVATVAFQGASIHIAHNNTAGFSFDSDQVQHLVARKKLYATGCYLPHQGLISAQEQLLACLSPGIKRPRYLHAAKRAVAEVPAVLAREGHTLRHGLVDQLGTTFCQPVHVGFSRTKVASLNRVIEHAENRVPVIFVILAGVDAALCGHGVGAPGGILKAKTSDLISHLSQRGRQRTTGKARSHDNHMEFPAIAGTNQFGG